jgi:hypothetical protein
MRIIESKDRTRSRLAWGAVILLFLVIVPLAYWAGGNMKRAQALDNLGEVLAYWAGGAIGREQTTDSPGEALGIYNLLAISANEMEQSLQRVRVLDMRINDEWRTMSSEDQGRILALRREYDHEYTKRAMGYNILMEAWEYRFADAQKLPPGASKPLPRRINPFATRSEREDKT